MAALAAFGAQQASGDSNNDGDLSSEEEEEEEQAGARGGEDDVINWSDSDSDVVPGWDSSTSIADGDSDGDEWAGEWGEGGDGDSGCSE